MDYKWIIEINAFCFLCLTVLHISMIRNFDRDTKNLYYIKTMSMAMISFVLDVIWSCLSEKIIVVPHFINFLVNAAYYIVVIFAGYWWLYYVEVSLNSSLLKSKILRVIAALPIFLTIFGVVMSYWNGFFFFIDENGLYHRGKFILIHTIMCHFYTVCVSGHAFIKSIKTENYIKSKEYKVLSIFLFFPLSLGIIQILVPELPTVCMGLTLAYLYVYIDLQTLKISIDPLSGINNRNQLMKYVSSKLRHGNTNETTYLLMIDMNKFKKINDVYGHIEGDNAIIRVADSLKNACVKTNNFVARYGGDEFIIIANNYTEDDVRELIENINTNLFERCLSDKVKYDLTVSIGYAKYSDDIKNIQEFIAKADKELYLKKAELKK